MVRFWRRYDNKSRPVRFRELSLAQGDSHVQSLLRYIRLTSDRQGQEGWIFSRVPLTATNWEVYYPIKPLTLTQSV